MQQPLISTPAHPDTPPPMTPDQCAEHLREKHVQMIRDAQSAGREIPSTPVSMSLVGEELARTSVEASQRSMRVATRKMFGGIAMPWHKNK